MLGLRIGLACLCLGLATCSSTSKVAQENLGFEISDRAGSVSRIWTHSMPGLVTDLSLNRDGSRALVTLVPDPEGLIKNYSQPKIQTPHLALLNQDGDILWERSFDSKPKWQTLSAKGDLAVITTYEGKLTAVDGSGKTIWEQENYCKPIILERTSRILCHRWDDAKPAGVGFDLYDRAGVKTQGFAISGELLDISVASDESRVVLALTGGRVVVVDLETLKTVWEVRVGGEMIGVAISSGLEPILAVFSYKKSDLGKHQPSLVLFGSDGKQIEQFTPEGHFDQVSISPEGRLIGLYGNSAHGQLLVAFSRATPNEKFKELWRHQSNRYSDYNSMIVVREDRMIAGFEDRGASDSGKSLTHLFSFDRSGKVEWAVPLVSDEGGYLFSFAREGSEPFLLGVSDNGEISSFRVRLAH